MKNVVAIAVLLLFSFVRLGHADCTGTAAELTSLFMSCDMPSLLDSDLSATLDVFCSSTSDCSFSNFASLLDTLATDCGVSIIYDTIDPIIETVNLACIQVDGEYCMDVMWNLVTAGVSLPVTEAELIQYCDPCIPYYWSMFVSYSTLSSEIDLYSSYASVCMKDGDTWCALELQELASAFDAYDYQLMTEISCRSSCIERYSSLDAYFSDDQYQEAFDILCYQNENGDLCWPIALDAVQSSNVMNTCTSTVLTDDCKTSLESLIASTGCCFQSLYNNAVDEATVQRFETLISEAGLTIPDACGAATIPQLTMYLDNVDYQYAIDNWNDLSGWLMKDFNLNTGIPMSSIYAELLNDTGSGVYVLLQGLTMSDLSTSLTLDSLISILYNQGFSLYETAQSISDDSRLDPVTGVTVGCAASAATVVNSDQYGSAGTAVISLAALAVTLLALVL